MTMDAPAPTAPHTDPESPQAPKGWLRRNALALALAAVLLVTTVGITSWKEWSDYFGTRPTQPISAEVGIATEFGGTTWQLVDVLAGTSDDVATIPEGTTMILARVEVTPSGDPAEAPGCMLSLYEAGSGRAWNSAALRPIDYRTTPGYESSCLPDATEPYKLEVPFVVPTGASGDLSLVIEVADLLPQYLRLALPSL